MSAEQPNIIEPPKKISDAFRESIERVIKHDDYKDKGLELIGAGTEKVVFKVAGKEGQVFKIHRKVLGVRLKRGCFDGSDTARYYDAEAIETQMVDWEDEMELEKEVVEIFGEEHLLRRGIFRVTIPVTRELLSFYDTGEAKKDSEKDVHPTKSDDSNKNKEADEAAGEEVDSPDLPDGNIRILAESQEESMVMTNKDDYFYIPIGIEPIKKQEAFDGAKALNEVCARIKEKTDHQIKLMEDLIKDKYIGPVLKDLYSKIIVYTKKTGRMIDMMGWDNIVFYSKKLPTKKRYHIKNWDYKIIEFSFPGSKDAWMVTMQEDRHENYSCFVPYQAYYQLLHDMGKVMGIEDNISITDLYYFKDVKVVEK